MAGDVADRERDTAVGKGERVVPIAADDRFFRGRNVGGIEAHAFVFGQTFWQQGALQGVGDVMFARVDLCAVYRNGDAHGQLVEEVPVKNVHLGAILVGGDAESAHNAVARRQGEDARA